MLTDPAVRQAKPKEKPYKLADGRSMYLLVMPTGGRLWRLDYRHNGTRRTLALGSYPDVSLAKARERRDEARRLLADGIDPGAKRKAEKLAKADTFRAVAEEFLAQREKGWAPTHSSKVRARLEWLYPHIGARPIGIIEAPELLAPVRMIEECGKGETAKRTLLNAGQVFRFAVATGRAKHDPTADLRGALAPVRANHHPAIIEPKAFGALLGAIDTYPGEPVTRAALRLLPLVFTRPGELRLAEWAEFDLDRATWSIPSQRMKMKQPHIVPLSTQAVTILRELHPLTGRRRLVFPSLRSRDRPMADATLTVALRRLGFSRDEVVPHGFRATARTLLDEVLGVRPDLIEHQLAHAVKDPNGRAYNRTAHLAERGKMMQQWADYCDALKKSADVIPFPTRAS